MVAYILFSTIKRSGFE